MMKYPGDLKYTREDEWLKLDGQSGTLGITDYAQNQLGDIVFVELPKPGSQIQAGKSFGTVESVKAVSELYSPVSGIVEAVNEELNTAPEKVNSDPYGAWMIRVRLTDPNQAATLMSAEQYAKYAEERG